MPMAELEQVSAGTVVGSRFDVESLLGEGALGRVYRAVDQKTQRPVALRLLCQELCQDRETLERMRQRIGLASKLQHKNILSVYGLGREGGLHYIVMELVEGQSLRQLLAKKRTTGKSFSLKGAYNVVAHLCNALHFAHASLVHGFPGPNSILVNTVGRVKLGEFGVVGALPAGSGLLTSFGDQQFMAPEVRANPAEATAAADVYTLGMVLFELLTGQLPSGPQALPSQLLPELGAEVDEVIIRALDPEPGRRYTDVRQLKAAFFAAISTNVDVSVPPRETGPQEPVGDAAAWVESTTPPPFPVEQLPGGAAGVPTPPAARPAAAAPPVQAAQPAPPAAGSPFQIAPTVGGPGLPAGVLPANGPGRVTMEELLADDGGDTTERWLVQKDRLDFGPFSLLELKQQLHKQQFKADDMVLNKDSGELTRIRTHPLLKEFCVHLESFLASREAESLADQRLEKDKKRRTVTVLMVAFALVVLGACGAVAAWFLTKDPEIEERIVYREKEANIEKLLSGIEITWKKEKAKRKRKRRRRKPRPKAGTKAAASEDPGVTYLGDASKTGGDETLPLTVVERVMQRNFRKLVPCVHSALRRDGSLRAVNIDFGILGSGKVNKAKVNGKISGAFHGCILSKMKQIKFPSFDGALTPASFSMHLK